MKATLITIAAVALIAIGYLAGTYSSNLSANRYQQAAENLINEIMENTDLSDTIMEGDTYSEYYEALTNN